jgi:hypothetical protein
MARGETESGPRSTAERAAKRYFEGAVIPAPRTPVEDVWKQRRLRASISEKGAAPIDQPSWRFSLAM